MLLNELLCVVLARPLCGLGWEFVHVQYVHSTYVHSVLHCICTVCYTVYVQCTTVYIHSKVYVHSIFSVCIFRKFSKFIQVKKKLKIMRKAIVINQKQKEGNNTCDTIRC